MKTSLLLSAVALLLAAVAAPSFAAPAGVTGRPPTVCNPINLPYCFQPGTPSWRTAADPVVIVCKGEYWLFATKSRGYWHSKDCVHWSLVTQTNLPLDNDAPGAFAIGNKLYWTAINSGIYETQDPEGGQWTLTNDTKSGGDPDLFRDTDGRVYLYSGCGVCGPISGQEVDPQTFKPLMPAQALIVADIPHHGGEIFAEPTAPPPYRPDYNWTEGPWMTKHGGKYYLQYSAPGTELKSYSDGVYVSSSPLGPFTYAPYSPFSFKPTGFIAGAGHSTTFQDFGGKLWRVSTMTISIRDKFERRLGLFPAGFTPDGQMVCDTYLGDYPQYAPGVVKNPSQGNFLQSNSPGWMLLSYRKQATASSTLSGHPVGNAFNEDIRTWWSAQTGNPGEWLQVDLGHPCRLEAAQINFADEGAVFAGRLADGYGYKLEGSQDGKTWTLLVDRRAAPQDAPHDYLQLDKPVMVRYARITNTHSPAGAKFSLSGLRLFGSGLGRAPQAASGVLVTRNAADSRQAAISWKPVPGADGYVVRYGIAPDKLYSSYQVYGASSLSIHTLNTGVPYYFTVDTFSSSGVTPGKTVASG